MIGAERTLKRLFKETGVRPELFHGLHRKTANGGFAHPVIGIFFTGQLKVPASAI